MTSKIHSIHVKDLEGVVVDLISRYNNRILLLIIYNNDCLGCTGRAIPLAHEFQTKYPSIQVIGIHADFKNREGSKTSITRIFRNGQIPFPIYIDEHHRVYDQFKAEGTPQWVLITENGVLFRSFFGSQANAQNRLYYAIEALINS